MPDTREPRSVVDAAERAAAAGDYASAEQLLREAAALQEARLGPLHPDLAHTLNNLGVVCEITDKPVDAEDFFRRACAIATAVLAPDHPFVATSRQNLEDFCSARGKAVPDGAVAGLDEFPRERPAFEEPQIIRDEPRTVKEVPGTVGEAPRTVRDEPPVRTVESTRPSRPLARNAAVAVGLLLTFIAIALWLRTGEQVASSEESASVSPGSPVTAVAPPAEPIATDPRSDGVTTAPTPTSGAPIGESSSPPPATAETRTTAASVPLPPSLVTAELCSDLSTGGPRGWQCVPASLPAGPGPLFFYTRIKSPTDTTVQHRWYRDDRLRRVKDLPIRANTTDGYRTYSRNTVDNQGAGDWRVELRTKDGVLLHEERFVVR